MKRLKRTLKWTGVSLGGLIAIGLIANAVFVWTTSTRLEHQLAAVRAAGDPLTLAELAPKPIPPEENAATYLRRAQADIDVINNEIEVSEVMSLIAKDNKLYQLPPEVQKVFKAAFNAYPKVFPLLEQAVACPDYDPQLDYSLSDPGEFIAKVLPNLQTLRADARVLRYRVWLLVAEGDYDEAMHTALVLFRLAHHCNRIPGLVGYLVAITVQGIAIDSANLVLQTGPISKELRDTLDTELAVQERMDEYIQALKVDRVFNLGFLTRTSYRVYVSGSPLGDCWLIGRGVWNQREAEYLDKMCAFIAVLREQKSYRQVEDIIGKSYFQVRTSDPAGSAEEMERQPFLGIPITFQCATRLRATIRSLRVLNALQARLLAGGKEVPKLAELDLPAETTTDPFTGGPLHVRRTPHGWLIYSVGPNFQDDGGNLLNDPTKDIDVGIGPPPVAEPTKSDHEKNEEE